MFRRRIYIYISYKFCIKHLLLIKSLKFNQRMPNPEKSQYLVLLLKEANVGPVEKRRTPSQRRPARQASFTPPQATHHPGRALMWAGRRAQGTACWSFYTLSNCWCHAAWRPQNTSPKISHRPAWVRKTHDFWISRGSGKFNLQHDFNSRNPNKRTTTLRGGGHSIFNLWSPSVWNSIVFFLPASPSASNRLQKKHFLYLGRKKVETGF